MMVVGDYSVIAGLAVTALLFHPFLFQAFLFQASVTSDVQKPITGAHTLDRSDPVLAEAQSFLETGRLSDAERVVRHYLESHSNSADAHYLLGYILFKEVNAKASLAEYTEGAKYRVPSAFDLKVVACDYVLLKDYLHADQWFTKSVEWNPKDLQTWYYLGRTKYNENRFEEAIRAFTECLKLDPTNVKAEDNLGLSYAGLGRTNEAIAAFRNAIAWQAKDAVKDPGPFINLGTLLVDNNRLEEAIPYLLQAEEIAPGESRVHRELGKAYLRLNQPAKAQVELEKAVQLAPQDASLHFILGQVYRKQGQGEKAKVEFDRYAVLNKPDASRETPAR